MSAPHFVEPAALGRSKSFLSVEWPTLLLALFIYLSWIFLIWFWQSIPFLLLFVAGGWIIAWHGSLQHEVLHGHPTRSRRINDAIGWVPISLWLPYRLYKSSHLQHHRDEWLTDPIEDPESYYLTGPAWQRMGPFGRMITAANNTLPGRLIIGPFVALAALWGSEASRLLKGDFSHAGLWFRHALGVAAVLYWVMVVCAMPLWLYLVAFAYAGLSFSRLRSFAEHQYAGTKEERTAIVENTPAFGLLFLHNNLHIVHHSLPQLAWYRIPALYRKHRADFIALNGGLIYDGYIEVARRYFVRQHHQPVHPDHQAAPVMPVLDPKMATADQASSG
jgi:fatty acid desaturase